MNDNLILTQAQFEAMHAAIDKTRSSSRNVTIDKEALKNLLVDHATLLATANPLTKTAGAR